MSTFTTTSGCSSAIQCPEFGTVIDVGNVMSIYLKRHEYLTIIGAENGEILFNRQIMDSVKAMARILGHSSKYLPR
jgi:hypothetical protein